MTERTSLIEAAVAALRARITSGEWSVGTRIPPEPALTEEAHRDDPQASAWYRRAVLPVHLRRLLTGEAA